MRWNNPKVELDKKAKKIVNIFKKRNKIALFGAGKIGTEIRVRIDYYGIFDGYIDNDVAKQQSGWDNVIVYSIQDYLQYKNGWIVVSTGEENYEIIGKQLIKEGLTEKIDFWYADEFVEDVLPILSFYFFNKLYVDLAQISVTERCTLHCRKCAHACQNVDPSTKDLSIETVKESADYFFKYVDIVYEFVLIGGEPFLYKRLKDVVEYIGEHYREKMILFSITTNGTIVPDDEIIDLCRKYDITVRVSDYSETLPRLLKRYELLYKRTDDLKVIIWKTGKKDSWFDYGYDVVDRGVNTEVLIEAFDKCRTRCREIRGTKYYYCVMARSIPENTGLDIGKDDFLELRDIDDKKIFFEYQQGFSKKGYMDMCRYCRGADAKKHLIPAAEQEEKL